MEGLVALVAYKDIHCLLEIDKEAQFLRCDVECVVRLMIEVLKLRNKRVRAEDHANHKTKNDSMHLGNKLRHALNEKI